MFSIACRNMLHAASSHSFRHRIGLADHASRLSISRANQPLVGSTCQRMLITASLSMIFRSDVDSHHRHHSRRGSRVCPLQYELSTPVITLRTKEKAGERLSEIRNLTRGIIPADGDDRS